VIRRLGACVLQIVAISAIAFFVFSVAPGDFYSAERLNPQMNGRSLAQWRAAKGLDKPWPERYSMWVRSALRGEMGTSLAYGVPVMMLIAPRISRSVAILLPSLLLGWFLGLAMAFWAARRRDRLLEPAMSIAGMSPEVILISLLLWIAVYAGVPLTGAWLPVTGLACIIVPLVFLHAFGAFLAARDAAFVRIAESRGVGPWRLWTRFVLPAASNPLISLLGPSLATAIGSSLVVEAMTGWPGLGPLFLEAVQARDYEVVQAVIVLIAVALTVTNFVADLLLYWLDPRIRLSS
jgi:ABC-type dipeptide/oligopeptide/nickel transport system permease component